MLTRPPDSKFAAIDVCVPFGRFWWIIFLPSSETVNGSPINSVGIATSRNWRPVPPAPSEISPFGASNENSPTTELDAIPTWNAA